MFAADAHMSHWLMFFRNPDDYPDWSKTPFRLADGRYAATDSKIAAVTAEQMPFDVPMPDEKMMNRVAVISKCLAEPAQKTITLPRETVLAMFGPCEHPVISECEDCDGTGFVPHNCSCDLCEVDDEDCRNCDGIGKAQSTPDTQYALLWGHPLNANLVAYVLAHAPAAEQYTLEICSQNGVHHLRIVTPTWTAIVVMMMDNVLREHECMELIPEDTACSSK